MQKFLVLSLIGVGLLVWLFWPKPETSHVFNSSTQTKERVQETRTPASIAQVTDAAHAPHAHLPIPEQDIESLGNECLENLIENATPSLENFRKKLIDDSSVPVGLWMYDKSAPIQATRKPSSSDFFLRGLANANMMAGRENKNPDLPGAIELLLKAHDKDPENAAAIIFAAYLKKQVGDENGAKELLDQVNIEDMKFKTYEIDTLFHVYKHIKTPKDLLNFFQVREKMPIVDPGQIKIFLAAQGRQDVGYLMMQNELDPESRHHSSPDGDILFYSTGRGLIREISPNEADKYPHPRLLMEKMKDHMQYKLIDTSDLGRECDVRKLQPLVDYFQELVQ